MNAQPTVEFVPSSSNFFDAEALAYVLEAHETDFETTYDMTRVAVKQPAPSDFYLFKDNGADILFVAHLDTVGPHHERTAHVVDTADGTVVYSRALDDRLGAYVGLELLPQMGMTFDYLLTVGEEDGMSTASFFNASDHHDRHYNWIIEFDRGGTDVVLYQYEDDDLVEMVEETGARVEQGIFSDISYMEHVGVKAMNWGVGYRDYHGPRAHVWIEDMFYMVDFFVTFHQTWASTHLPHVKTQDVWSMNWRAWAHEHPTHDKTPPGEEGVCVESSMWEDGCEGDVDDTEYGPLCSVHRAWYRD